MTKREASRWPFIILAIGAVVALVFIILSATRSSKSDSQRFAETRTRSTGAEGTGRSAKPATPSSDESDAGGRLVHAKFDICAEVRVTCVVDGDTIWLDGQKIRVADIDTPEISEPKCASELELGQRATRRLLALLNDGPFELHAIGGRDEDRYGRRLRVISREGRSLGDQLVAEGLARTWTGRREPWC